MKRLLTSAAVLIATVGSVLAVFGTAPAMAQSRSYYGAIAVSIDTGHYSFTYNYSSYSEAESAAVSSCLRNGGGSDCDAKLSWRNGCGALAISKGWWSYGSGATITAAKNKALSNNPGSARIEHWNCTSGYSL